MPSVGTILVSSIGLTYKPSASPVENPKPVDIGTSVFDAGRLAGSPKAMRAGASRTRDVFVCRVSDALDALDLADPRVTARSSEVGRLSDILVLLVL